MYRVKNYNVVLGISKAKSISFIYFKMFEVAILCTGIAQIEQNALGLDKKMLSWFFLFSKV